MARSGGRARYLLLAAIVGLGLVLRLWGIGWGLHNADISRRTHPDEWVLYWLFQWFDSSHAPNPCPSSPHQCFFDWGAVYPTVAYGVHFLVNPILGLLPAHLFGPRADPLFVRPILAGRLTSAILSTATIPLAYKIGQRAFGIGAGLLGALLVALSGLLIQLAHFATPDSTTLFLMALTLLLAFRSMEAPSAGRFALAGVIWGAATGSEYHMALLAAPLAVAWWLSADRRASYLAIASAVAALTFLLLNPYIILAFPGFLAATEHTLRIRTVDSGVQYGNRWAPYAPSWLYVARYPLGYGVGFALAGWMLVGLAWSVVRRTRADYFLLAWVVPYYLLVTVEPAKFMRYSAPLLLPLAILAGRFAVELLGWRPRAVVRLLIAAAAAFALSFSAVYDAAYAGMFSSPDPRAVAAGWLSAHAPTGASISYEEIPDGVVNLAFFLTPPHPACFSQLHANRLRGASYAVLDSYSGEEIPDSLTATRHRFLATLARSTSYRMAAEIHYVPTFLGLRFPIDGSPHDWRYPSHVITIYRNRQAPVPAAGVCFNSLTAAAAKLYVRPAGG